MIFIVGCHKSGTSLVRALLDGHPNLAVIPFESHFANAYGIPVLYPLKRTANSPPRSAKELSDRLIHQLCTYIQNHEPAGDTNLPWLSSDQLRNREVECLPHFLRTEPNRSSLLAYFSTAYYLATGESPGQRTLVEKSVENSELVPLLLANFPDARILQVWRDPLAVLAALRRTRSNPHASRRSYPYLRPLLGAIETATVAMRRNALWYPDRVLNLQYERLLESPDHETSRLASFLSIPPQEALQKPTEYQEPWGGNSSIGLADTAIDSSRLTGTFEALPLEHQVIGASLFLNPSSSKRKPQLSRTLSSLRRSPREGLATYVANRLLIAAG